MDDIPTAIRERKNPQKPTSNNPVLFMGVLGLGAIAVLIIFLINSNLLANSNQNSDSKVVKNQTTETTKTSENENNDSIDTDTANAETNSQDSSKPTETPVENVLGHLPYEEVDISKLKPITNDGRIKLRENAAQKFLQMQKDARYNGIVLVPISGFRSVSEQEYLFFEIKAQRAQVASKRAEVSAPPGYSEHHTGYAVDIGDGKTPATNLSPSFDKTAAYKWLEKNAPRYSFELSFTPDNLQGISYEPWHWRYVGDTESLETFYKARSLETEIDN